MLRKALQRYIAEAQPYRMAPAGERKRVTVSAESEMDSCGRVCRVMGVLMDITEKRVAEDKHGRMADTIRATPDSMSDAFYQANHDWKFLRQPQAEQLLERAAANLIGRRLWNEFPSRSGASAGVRCLLCRVGGWMFAQLRDLVAKCGQSCEEVHLGPLVESVRLPCVARFPSSVAAPLGWHS